MVGASPRRPVEVLGQERVRPLAVDHVAAGEELDLGTRRDTREPKASLRDLKHVAERRDATLILFPDLPGLHGGATDAALDAAQVALQAIDGVLER